MRDGNGLSRRAFVAGGLGTAAAAGLPGGRGAERQRQPVRHKVCVFIKFLQALSYKELAETVAEMGFDGIEATVRNGGYILPEHAEQELPKLVEALRGCGLEVTLMASSINSVRQPYTEKVLRTAARLGIKRYRLAGYRYDLSKPVLEQLERIRPVLAALAALNRELGLTGLYQNHSGAHNVGAVVWDIYSLIKEHPAEHMAMAFDIRHATVEGGLAWPVHFNLVRSHLGVVYVKDFRWDGRRPVNVPLGEGQVDRRFFTMLKQSGYRGPVSLHVEYLTEAGTAANVAALRTDLKTLRAWLGA